MPDLEKSNQVLDCFQTEIDRQRATELSKANATFQPDQVEVVPRLLPQSGPEEFAQQFRDGRDEVAAAIAELVGDDSSQQGAKTETMPLLQSVQVQANHCDRVRRASALYFAPRMRRKIHAAARRQSHGVEGGYFDRHVLGRVTELIRKYGE